MNYFGLCFTFMLPGIVLGILGGAVVYEARAKRAARLRRKRAAAARGKLYMADLRADAKVHSGAIA